MARFLLYTGGHSGADMGSGTYLPAVRLPPNASFESLHLRNGNDKKNITHLTELLSELKQSGKKAQSSAREAAEEK